MSRPASSAGVATVTRCGTPGGTCPRRPQAWDTEDRGDLAFAQAYARVIGPQAWPLAALPGTRRSRVWSTRGRGLRRRAARSRGRSCSSRSPACSLDAVRRRARDLGDRRCDARPYARADPASKAVQRVPNPHANRDYEVDHVVPEFTCVCPMTGQPDFATIRIRYVPDRWLVELKSLKLYIWAYRNEGAFHEDVTNRILDRPRADARAPPDGGRGRLERPGRNQDRRHGALRESIAARSQRRRSARPGGSGRAGVNGAAPTDRASNSPKSALTSSGRERPPAP